MAVAILDTIIFFVKGHISFLPRFLEGGLDDLEDFYLADATMERVRKGQEAILSASQVRKALDLDY